MSDNKPHRIFARLLYDGSGRAPSADQVVTMADGRITEVAGYDARLHGVDLPEHAVVTPGLIDIQINGADDVQFNDLPTVDTLARMAKGAAKGGTAWIMPTFVTAPAQDYLAAIAAVKQALAAGIEGILGLHLEGPFLSPARPGIHDPLAIRKITPDDIAAISQDFPAPLLLTLAPEEAPAGVIADLTARGVTVFAGHSASSYDDMRRAVAEGLRGATHLFNAMSQIGPREPGVVGSVLGGKDLYAGIIADGHHVHWHNLAMAIRAIPTRLCLVTDAMLTLAGTRQSFDLHGETIGLQDGRLTNADGTLAGAHVAMDESIRNLVDRGLTSPEWAVRMASYNPACALHVDGDLGLIRAGYRAVLSVFDDGWHAQGVVRGA